MADELKNSMNENKEKIENKNEILQKSCLEKDCSENGGEKNSNQTELNLEENQDKITIKDEENSELNNDEITNEDDQEDRVVTMIDVLEEEKALEEQTNAVLGGSDDKNCTYNQGYVGRQALYSCKTCYENNKESNEYSGICLACSLHCHDGHELFELYTKRNFRCDCGNSKFLSACKLSSKKEILNENNKYNHNFKGEYCICNRPYPDEEFDDTMIQCVHCEDWLHSMHIGSSMPDNNDYSEFICEACIKKLPFLRFYQPVTVKIGSADDREGDVQIKIDGDDEKVKKEINPDTVTEIDSGIDSSSDSVQPLFCKLQKLMEKKTELTNSDEIKCTFWSDNWRLELCKCSSCLQLYKENNCEYLLDENDTVVNYELKGKERSIQVSQYERGLNEISKMDRIKSIEAITECNTMAAELKDYLKKFADNKKVVREEDIAEFFEQFKQRKRQKLEVYNCR